MIPPRPETPEIERGEAPPNAEAPLATDAPPSVEKPIEPAGEATPQRVLTRAERRRALRRPRRWRRWAVAGMIMALLAGAGGFAAVRLSVPVPLALVRSTLVAETPIPGSLPVIAWPSVGEGAISIPEVGFGTHSPRQAPVPIASLTKIMTAYLILHDRPLAPGADGPTVTMTAADAADALGDMGLGEANVRVLPGEVLTERQLLEGLLVHSANNLADTLARWDAGSVPAFVAEMNTTAAALGMAATHYADPSGFDVHSQSTPADQLRVATLVMQDPTFARIVALSRVTLPVVGTVGTFTPLLGLPRVVGVKSGFTDAAGGCDVLAFRRTVQGRNVLVFAAVTGQAGADPLATAGYAALGLASAAGVGVQLVSVLPSGAPVATVRVRQGVIDAVTAVPATILGYPGETVVSRLVVTRRPRPGAPGGSPVGRVVSRLGSQSVAVAVRTGRGVPPETLVERLF